MLRKWLTYRSRGKLITLLTFEISSFRENGFLLFRAVAASRWTPKSARRQNRENGHTHAGQLLQPSLRMRAEGE